MALNITDILPSEERVLSLLSERPYDWIAIDLPRSRMPRQRLYDRGMIEVKGEFGIDRRYRLSPVGLVYMDIPPEPQEV